MLSRLKRNIGETWKGPCGRATFDSCKMGPRPLAGSAGMRLFHPGVPRLENSLQSLSVCRSTLKKCTPLHTMPTIFRVWRQRPCFTQARCPTHSFSRLKCAWPSFSARQPKCGAGGVPNRHAEPKPSSCWGGKVGSRCVLLWWL